jgi:hypothetical protein
VSEALDKLDAMIALLAKIEENTRRRPYVPRDPDGAGAPTPRGTKCPCWDCRMRLSTKNPCDMGHGSCSAIVAWLGAGNSPAKMPQRFPQKNVMPAEMERRVRTTENHE